MKYFSIHRPVMIGSYPKSQKVLEIKNFDSSEFIDSIGRQAWSWIEYEKPLTEKEADDYELLPEVRAGAAEDVKGAEV